MQPDLAMAIINSKTVFSGMVCSLTITRYPKWLGWAGVLSMAVFRLPLIISKRFSFWKLMGSGKNGTFDKVPDWRQWAVLLVSADEKGLAIPYFIQKWWHFFGCETFTLVLEPIEGHGVWDGKTCFGQLPRSSDYDGMIGILTRATIRVSGFTSFWKHVPVVARQMEDAQGLIHSFGIGEIPWIKQATFSIWENKAAMKKFAYQMQEHAEVIRKTHAEKWYSEEMFVRFRILSANGTLRGKSPLTGKL